MHVIRNIYLRLSVKWKVILIFTSFLAFMSGLFIIGFNYINKLYDRQLLHSSSELLNLYSTNIENELRKIENMTFAFFNGKQHSSRLGADQRKRIFLYRLQFTE
ncbi:hypothetical protein HMSSN036_74460 [Paenibacillus macerans]|nr:hypothetical protein HMSSN036_74460 [Paenibacillus macerans]